MDKEWHTPMGLPYLMKRSCSSFILLGAASHSYLAPQTSPVRDDTNGF